MESNHQKAFWQFSDQIRLQTSSFANLGISDSIWSTSFGSKRSEDRLNFDVHAGGDVNSSSRSKPKDLNSNDLNDSGWSTALATRRTEDSRNYDLIVNASGSSSAGGLKEGSNFDGWKAGFANGPVKANYPSNDGAFVGNSSKTSSFQGGGLGGKGIYSKSVALNRSSNINARLGKEKNDYEFHGGGKAMKKNGNSERNNNNSEKGSVDKRFKSLPASESLPRNEIVGGYIFVCNNDTMEENLRRQLFGLPPRYRDSVRAITPGLPLFLYNYSTHQLHGIFEAASFGGSNIDPCAWEDKKSPGESRFPAQVMVTTRKCCEPLEEDSFRPVLHHYDGPKFRLELNIPEVISLLDIFEESTA